MSRCFSSIDPIMNAVARAVGESGIRTLFARIEIVSEEYHPDLVDIWMEVRGWHELGRCGVRPEGVPAPTLAEVGEDMRRDMERKT